jgi:cell division protein ZapA
MELHDITMMGRAFRIRSESEQDYLENVAAYVDKKINDMVGDRRHLAGQNVALMVALNMADELFQLREEHDSLRDNIRKQSEVLLQRMGHQAT